MKFPILVSDILFLFKKKYIFGKTLKSKSDKSTYFSQEKQVWNYSNLEFIQKLNESFDVTKNHSWINSKIIKLLQMENIPSE